MCGRFTLTKSPDSITRHFGLPPAAAGLAPRYNIAPTQTVAAVRQAAAGGRELALLRWGLIPAWADPLAPGTGIINARAETVATKPAFRAAYRQRRCLVPADGFYEWQALDGRKQPWYFQLQGEEMFAFGGLWERWQGAFVGAGPSAAAPRVPLTRAPGSGARSPEPGARVAALETCVLLTTAPNPLLAAVHNRMPLILAPNDYDAWLAADNPAPDALLRPYPAEAMEGYRVHPRVGNARTDDAACRAPLPPDLDSG